MPSSSGEAPTSGQEASVTWESHPKSSPVQFSCLHVPRNQHPAYAFAIPRVLPPQDPSQVGCHYRCKPIFVTRKVAAHLPLQSQARSQSGWVAQSSWGGSGARLPGFQWLSSRSAVCASYLIRWCSHSCIRKMQKEMIILLPHCLLWKLSELNINSYTVAGTR